MDWLLLAVLAAQPPHPSQLLAPDSGRAVNRARSAQEGFESDRRHRLPLVVADVWRDLGDVECVAVFPLYGRH